MSTTDRDMGRLRDGDRVRLQGSDYTEGTVDQIINGSTYRVVWDYEGDTGEVFYRNDLVKMS